VTTAAGTVAGSLRFDPVRLIWRTLSVVRSNAVAGSLRFDLQALGADRRRGPAGNRARCPVRRIEPGRGSFQGPRVAGLALPITGFLYIRKGKWRYYYPAAAGPSWGSLWEALREQFDVRTHLLAGAGCRGNRPRGPSPARCGSTPFDLQALGADQRRGRLRTVPGARCAASSPAAVVTVTGSYGSRKKVCQDFGLFP